MSGSRRSPSTTNRPAPAPRLVTFSPRARTPTSTSLIVPSHSPSPRPGTPHSGPSSSSASTAAAASASASRPMLALPKVSFRIVDDGRDILVGGRRDGRRGGVQDGTSRSYGYNDSSDFERPEHYIRHIEPIEAELKNQVEYDMDEQDQEWLDQLNAERKKEQSDAISYELFEVIMDRLEKEWFDLTKLIPNPKADFPSEEAPCAVCDDGEGENSNAIVFCDGCNLAVHQDCYGVPYIPEGQWLCRKCTVSPEHPVSCVFCPKEGGAFKQTSTGQWAHLLCAIWIPEVVVGNYVYMEPIEGVVNIPRPRWKLHCTLCKHRHGACIQCAHPSCYTAFHVTCAREHGYLGTMKTLDEAHGGTGDSGLLSWCDKHLPPEMAELIAARPPVNSNSKKSAKAYAKTYLPPAPLVPAKILDAIVAYVQRMPGRKKRELVERAGRYWSLKREARRGAPLLKRLHLEPWTQSASTRQQTDEDKAKKLEYLIRIRNDLEKVRMLAELVRKREREKLRKAHLMKEVLDAMLFPHEGTLRAALDKISAQDRNGVFLQPVSVEEVPDYYDIIKEPMWFERISEKLDKHKYENVQEFKDDILLIFRNAMIYNTQDSAIWRLAQRNRTFAEPILAGLDAITLLSDSPAAADAADPLHLAPSQSDLQATLSSLVLLEELEDPADPTSDILSQLFSSTIPASFDSDLLLSMEPLGSTTTVEHVLKLEAPSEVDPFEQQHRVEGAQVANTSSNLAGDAAAVETEYSSVPTTTASPRKTLLARDSYGQLTSPSRLSKSPAKSKSPMKPSTTSPLQVTTAPALLNQPPPVSDTVSLTSIPGPSRSSTFSLFASPPKRSHKRKRQDTPPPAPEPTSDLIRAVSAHSPLSSTSSNAVAGPSTLPPFSPSTSSEKKLSAKLKRRASTHSSQSGIDRDIALTVTDIDPHSTFLRFETGWILPAGTRRGGRPAAMDPAASRAPAWKPKPRARKPASLKAEVEPAKATQTILEETGSEAAGRPPPSPPTASSSGPAASTVSPSATAMDVDSHEEQLAGRRTSTPLTMLTGLVSPRARSSSLSDLSDGDEARASPSARRFSPRKVSKGIVPFVLDSSMTTTKNGAHPLSPPSGASVLPRLNLNDDSMDASDLSAPPSEADDAVANTPNRRTRRLRSGNSVSPKKEEESTPKQRRSRPRADTWSSSKAAPPRADDTDGESGHGDNDEEDEIADNGGKDETEVAQRTPEASIPGRRQRRKGAALAPRRSVSKPKSSSEAPRFQLSPSETSGSNRLHVVDKGRKSKRQSERGFVHGTLVWAKLTSYPFFPAQLVNPDEVDTDEGELPVPPAVLAAGERHRKAEESKGSSKKVWLCRFYDATLSWAWIGREGLELLGENKETDESMLEHQKVKSSKARADLRAAYDRALGDIESDALADVNS